MNMLTIDIHASTNNPTLILLSANTLSQCEAYLKTISHISVISGIRQNERPGITVGEKTVLRLLHPMMSVIGFNRNYYLI
ncbi:Uncharacterised protein [Salmonella enterica subsp. arizonae]|uniref:Uncharacterized protein n=1 Tax=Salmonella enterica subsp. arizonae TaxID=59203 RepID=A0A2X4TEE2_SALER|nr:Uncharacterised protein [Salmonella enterica subsp. arizonae]